MDGLSTEERKSRGAFYTEAPIAEFLVAWGLERAPGVVMDPSCGDGRFLAAAAALGAASVVGCDAHAEAVALARRNLNDVPCPTVLIESDFFKLDPSAVGPVDLVVGNPPFIRYQRFKGESRRLAQASARGLGVKLNGLSASWAPFLIHSIRFLRPGGAMAMVVPAELVQTGYGLATLRGLARHFEALLLVSFERNVFRGVQEETLLLLAEGRGGATESVGLVARADALELTELLKTDPRSLSVDVSIPRRGPLAFASAYLTSAQREAWEEISGDPSVAALGDLGDVTNGYVTGANAFFHRTWADALGSGLPAEWLRATAKSSRSLLGLSYSAADLATLEASGNAHHLVVPEEGALGEHADVLAAWIRQGEALRVHERFKCRTRSPWWRVPGLTAPDVFIPYMVGRAPHACVNEAGALYSNSLHGVRLREGVDPRAFVLSMLSVVGRLSMELEGRSYGGGILKLEPSEAERIRVPRVDVDPGRIARAFAQADSLVRRGLHDEAAREADSVILIGSGLTSEGAVEGLREARSALVSRRTGRSSGAGRGTTER